MDLWERLTYVGDTAYEFKKYVILTIFCAVNTYWFIDFVNIHDKDMAIFKLFFYFGMWLCGLLALNGGYKLYSQSREIVEIPVEEDK